jgi:hypothetical protein
MTPIGGERAMHVVPLERCGLVEIGEVRCSGFVCSHIGTDLGGFPVLIGTRRHHTGSAAAAGKLLCRVALG